MALGVEKHGLLRVDVQLGGPGYHPFLVDTGQKLVLFLRRSPPILKASLTSNCPDNRSWLMGLASAAKARLLVGYVLDHEIFQRTSTLCRLLRREF